VIVVFLTELLVPKNDRKGEILSILAIGLAALSIKNAAGDSHCRIQPDFLMVYLVQGKTIRSFSIIPVIP
jgi:hypothetical protein